MIFNRAAVVLMCACLSGCSSLTGSVSDMLPSAGLGASVNPAAKLASASASSDQQYIQHVMDLRKRYRGSTDTAGLEELRRAETEAGSHFLTVGDTFAREERYEQAIEKFDAGLMIQPQSAELQTARQRASSKKELVRLYSEALRAKSVSNFDLADTLLQRAVALDPQNPNIKKELADLERTKKGEEQHFVLVAFQSPVPVAVNFRDAKLKDVLKVLCDRYDLNFVFDKNVDNLDVSVSARNVTFEQAFNMVLQSSNTAYKVLGPNSIFIYENTPEKKKLHADRYFKTFHLSTLKADRMAEILKGSMEIKTLVANNDLGTIQVRDTREALDVIDKLIAANDRKPAEIMLNLEVLEIDRTKAENLGVDWGSQASVQFPAVTLQSLFAQGANALNQGAVTLPTVALNYLKTNTDARTLSNPRIRTVDGQPAKIHVGDRVPLQSATIQQATGQTAVMYEYHDIGIKMDVLPKYHLDDSIFIDLNIEVSSLGQNLGTAAAPAYEIGTRNVHTTMILREGETAIIGGLISEDEQHSVSGVPGLSDSIMKGLFSNPSSSADRTEIVITVTPNLVRPQSLPRRGHTDFYSGTEGSYSIHPAYDYLNKPPRSGTPPKYILNPDNKKSPTQTSSAQPQPSGWQPAGVTSK